MLIPRFSIRWLLAMTTACAVFFAIVASAVRGQIWAVAISVSVASLAVAFLLYAIFFLFAWWVSLIVDAARPTALPRSPFADASMPPQLVPPDDQE